ncbi:hypothetical protein NC651_006379 [Populus alba x Populus x berolinensis]|nr:hypothetical protein NC651_006379 [Populus alba x Populus x berolinensis]
MRDFSENTSYKNGNSSNLSLTTSFLINNSPISPPSTRPASLTVASDRVYNTSADALCVMATSVVWAKATAKKAMELILVVSTKNQGSSRGRGDGNKSRVGRAYRL